MNQAITYDSFVAAVAEAGFSSTIRQQYEQALNDASSSCLAGAREVRTQWEFQGHVDARLQALLARSDDLAVTETGFILGELGAACAVDDVPVNLQDNNEAKALIERAILKLTVVLIPQSELLLKRSIAHVRGCAAEIAKVNAQLSIYNHLDSHETKLSDDSELENLVAIAALAQWEADQAADAVTQGQRAFDASIASLQKAGVAL